MYGAIVSLLQRSNKGADQLGLAFISLLFDIIPALKE